MRTQGLPRSEPPVDDSAIAQYRTVRRHTGKLCQTLEPEDYVVQSMPDASPAKWHLAHTSWFFERFLLVECRSGYRPFDERFDYLFNSYYYTAGPMHGRPRRGLLSRPAVADVLRYRAHVDDAVEKLIESDPLDPGARNVLMLGLHHEQQHQELLLTDLKHLFSQNPLEPAVAPALPPPPRAAAPGHAFLAITGGIHEIGHSGEDFAFDNETPRHRVLLDDFRIGSRLVTNGEYRDFVRDGAYARPELWLSDGWATLAERGWQRPLYWDEELCSEFTLAGRRDLDPDAPVGHVSYYEADAYARWAGARLPTEFEWEVAAANEPVCGNLMASGYWQPAAAGPGRRQFFGDCWEWTASAYAPYPGFRPLAGSLGEYNGKFMCNQMTVRGGSCVTAPGHIRASYRSFFYPDARWQFLGIRLAG